MAETAKKKRRGDLSPVPPQTVHGVILFHPDPVMDARIRQVEELHAHGFTVNEIAETIERSYGQTCVYLRRIRQAYLAYITAFPEDFDAGSPEQLRSAILARRQLDTMLRRELALLTSDEVGKRPNPSNKVGLFKLVMRNQRELEELCGLHVDRVEHGGSLTVRDSMQELLDQAPDGLREDYLDALTAVVQHARQCAKGPPSPQPE